MIERRTILLGALAALAAPVGVAIAKLLPKEKTPPESLGGCLVPKEVQAELEELFRNPQVLRTHDAAKTGPLVFESAMVQEDGKTTIIYPEGIHKTFRTFEEARDFVNG